MSTLQEEMIFEILLRLPPKSIIRFKCVAKAWQRLFTTPLFINRYLNLAITNNNLKVMLRSKLPRVDFSHPDFGKLGPSKLYSFDHVSVDCDYLVEIDYPSKSPSMELVLVGSCNGVVCIVPNFFAAYLFNPSTREYKRIPHGHLGDIEIPNNFTIEDFPIAYGFGYDQVVEDYKVVRMVSLINRNNYEKNLSEVRVYSLGSNLWRWIGNVTYKVVNGVSGVFVNGALYWVVRDYTREEGSTTVVGFDIGGEEFREVPEPEYGYEDFVKTLCVYQGRLCLLCNCQGVCLDVWVLNDYGVKRSWEKLFKFEQPAVIPSFRFVIPLCVSKNSKVLVEKDGDAFVLYDPKCKRARDLPIQGLPNRFCAITYLETLVSLDTGNALLRLRAAANT
ncbi:hypothetical protein GIB67_005309 [Kingdonia uniflora]|uniref:F-box domain-containing protein n=1 Tax=Kingdonia uniflora TaxID=39325 RepID=A0A7J7MGE6_9MAGN|nr:hypothetical protein GIB67_005309 [Kingdonia uniflora]